MGAEPWCVCWSKSGGRAYYWRPPPGPAAPPASIFPHDWAAEPSLVLTFQCPLPTPSIPSLPSSPPSQADDGEALLVGLWGPECGGYPERGGQGRPLLQGPRRPLA